MCLFLLTLKREVKASPIIIEYANEARKHIAVMHPEINPAVFGLIVFAQASWNELEFWSLQTLPMALNV